MMKTLHLIFGILLVVTFSACGKRAGGGDHGGHAHTAPHGGTLVEIGEHIYNVELVRDPAAGKLTAYVLDGHAGNFVRIAAPTIELIATPGGASTPLSLKAVGNPSTGETVGDTSQFEAQAEWLKTAGDFSGTFTIEIRGTKFERVAYSLSK